MGGVWTLPARLTPMRRSRGSIYRPGISPWAYPAPQPTEDAWHRLPDVTELGNLLDIARKAYRAPAGAEIVALPGADLGLSTIPWLFKTPMRVAVLGPTYSGHAQAWSAAGHSVSEVTSLDDAGKAAIIVAVNPNNPDGRLLSHADLADAANRVRKRDGLFILDEAFADADPSHSILPAATRLECTVVLRSFGKFYGAAGVRLGFAITSHPIAERLKAALGSWPVSSAAIAYGQAALSDERLGCVAAAEIARRGERPGSHLAGGRFQDFGRNRRFSGSAVTTNPGRASRSSPNKAFSFARSKS